MLSVDLTPLLHLSVVLSEDARVVCFFRLLCHVHVQNLGQPFKYDSSLVHGIFKIILISGESILELSLGLLPGVLEYDILLVNA